MNYFTRDGIVGKYQGIDVWVVDYRSFKKEMDNGEYLFAVKMPGENNYMNLVHKGTIIGYMNSAGSVQTYEEKERTSYKYFEEPPAEECKQRLEGYAEYSQIVDNFFKGLSELWKEIDNSFVE